MFYACCSYLKKPRNPKNTTHPTLDIAFLRLDSSLPASKGELQKKQERDIWQGCVVIRQGGMALNQKKVGLD